MNNPDVNTPVMDEEWMEMPYERHRRRLYLLRGMPCPLCPPPRPGWKVCPSPLVWTGISLACAQGHGWSNIDALRDDFRRRTKKHR